MLDGKISSMKLENFSNYKIYPNGKVYSKKFRRYLKPHNPGKGYVQYRLYSDAGKIKCFSGHRLVAICFLPNPDNKPTVNHKNSVRSDNRLENLEWATMSEQMLHAMSNGYKPNTSGIGKPGKAHGQSKPVTNGVKVYESMNLAEADGFDSGSISMCVNGKLKTHKGYQWSLIVAGA